MKLNKRTTHLRIEKCSKFIEEINRIEIENMSDDLFTIFLAGIERIITTGSQPKRKQKKTACRNRS